jgi:predicted amidohydrolase YtcJ
MKTSSYLAIAFFILISMNSCSQKESVDLIVRNGIIYTVDAGFSVAESFAVQEGIIRAVGSDTEISARYRSDKVIDVSGKFVYPGFHDAHCHFNGYATNLMQYADLTGTTSPEDVYAVLQEHHKKFGGEWLVGRGWDQNDWPEKRFPNKSELDKLFPDVPVYLIRIDGHAGWCNSKALEMAGITVSSNIMGGEVEVQDGEPTGILIDRAESLVMRHIPGITPEQQKKGWLEAQKNCFAVGLTSLTDCGLPGKTILLLDSMQKNGKLKIRMNAMLNPTEENIERFVKKGRYKTERLTVNTIKLFADGALGSRGALMLEEYSDDPGNKGLQMESQEFYDRICQLAYDHQYAVATHAIGDGGNRLMLDTYARFLKEENDRRWRIEHSQVIHPNDFEKFRKYSIVPSIQATHCTSDMYWAEERLGPERLKGAYAYQTLFNQLGWLPNGTDFPVESIDPLRTFYASVFRIDAEGWPQGGFLPDEALTREQALRSMTIWAAKASFEENEKGSLETGKYADFVILDTDLMKASPQEVLNAQVTGTWVGGEKVY